MVTDKYCFKQQILILTLTDIDYWYGCSVYQKVYQIQYTYVCSSDAGWGAGATNVSVKTDNLWNDLNGGSVLTSQT